MWHDKQHETLPVFLLWSLVFRLGFWLVVLGKVLLGLGSCSDKLGVMNGSPLIGPSCALLVLQRARNAARFSLAVFVASSGLMG